MCIPEPYELYDRYSSKLDAELEQCPVCDYCKHHIQDDYAWKIAEEFYHEECAAGLFKVALW